MKLVCETRVVGGKLEFKHKSVFLHDVHKLRDGDYILTLEKKNKKRSIFQNQFYWGVIIPLVKQGLYDNGYELTTELVHEYLKSNFSIKEIVNEHSGEILKLIGSTSEMTTTDMMLYFEKIMQWSAEYLNVIIPEPNSQLEITI